VELVNDGETVVEQDEARYADDGMLSGNVLRDDRRGWLAEQTPPDDRKARARILE
jgi:hypothetical protein